MKMNDSNYKYYLEDTLLEIINRANDAKKEYFENKTDFNAGVLQGYNESLTLLFHNLIAFDIIKEFNPEISKFNPDDLLSE